MSHLVEKKKRLLASLCIVSCMVGGSVMGLDGSAPIQMTEEFLEEVESLQNQLIKMRSSLENAKADFLFGRKEDGKAACCLIEKQLTYSLENSAKLEKHLQDLQMSLTQYIQKNEEVKRTLLLEEIALAQEAEKARQESNSHSEENHFLKKQVNEQKREIEGLQASLQGTKQKLDGFLSQAIEFKKLYRADRAKLLDSIQSHCVENAFLKDELLSAERAPKWDQDWNFYKYQFQAKAPRSVGKAPEIVFLESHLKATQEEVQAMQDAQDSLLKTFKATVSDKHRLEGESERLLAAAGRLIEDLQLSQLIEVVLLDQLDGLKGELEATVAMWEDERISSRGKQEQLKIALQVQTAFGAELEDLRHAQQSLVQLADKQQKRAMKFRKELEASREFNRDIVAQLQNAIREKESLVESLNAQKQTASLLEKELRDQWIHSLLWEDYLQTALNEKKTDVMEVAEIAGVAEIVKEDDSALFQLDNAHLCLKQTIHALQSEQLHNKVLAKQLKILQQQKKHLAGELQVTKKQFDIQSEKINKLKMVVAEN